MLLKCDNSILDAVSNVLNSSVPLILGLRSISVSNDMNVNVISNNLLVSVKDSVKEQVDDVKLVQESELLDGIVESFVCLNSFVTISDDGDQRVESNDVRNN